MKVQASVKKRCEGCYVTRRKKRLVVRCKRTRRHNQRQG